ncbi:MAG: DUF4097 family beta strand repeat-containing protein [Acidobacteriota bacterium]
MTRWIRCSFVWTTILMLTATAAIAWGDDCDHTAPREEVIDAAGAELVEIDASAGFLRVLGSDGAGQIQVRGEACASSERLLEDVQLEVRQSGDRVRIDVEIPDSSWGRSSTARLDLVIEVPSNVAVEIDDGSGSIEVRNVASAEIDDGSGSIEVRDVAGDLAIDDGSGEIEAINVAGEVRIDDGSGAIDLRQVGSVMIDEDGSGEIDIEEVYGDVMVRSDGSGSISVRDVDGDFTVRRDGSGGINHRAVAGLVDIPDGD